MSSPKDREPYETGNPEIDRKIEEIVQQWGVALDADRFREMIVTVLKFAADDPPRADIKLFNQSLKELRYSNKIFQPYLGVRKISIFGSARTLPSAPEYRGAYQFAQMMRDAGYMVITGGGGGIMAAAQAGAGRDRSFALNISLPFEQFANETIAGDRKCVSFKYFFNRKVNFIKHSHAVASFPGGVGTMDETFEMLTLIQTGKSSLIPVILVDHPSRGEYWNGLVQFLNEHMLKNGLISPEDFHLFKVTKSLEEAQDEVLRFYNNFHSYRYIRDTCVIRIQRPLPQSAVDQLSDEFLDILPQGGKIEQRGAFAEEIGEPEFAHLTRIAFILARRKFGRLRQLINKLNEF